MRNLNSSLLHPPCAHAFAGTTAFAPVTSCARACCLLVSRTVCLFIQRVMSNLGDARNVFLSTSEPSLGMFMHMIRNASQKHLRFFLVDAAALQIGIRTPYLERTCDAKCFSYCSAPVHNCFSAFFSWLRRMLNFNHVSMYLLITSRCDHRN